MTQRDTVSGRFTKVVDTSNVPESSAGKFPTRRQIPIEDMSARDVRAGMERAKYGPSADELAQGDPWPVHRRLAVMVSPDDDAATVYGNVQGALTREAARRQGGPFDPVTYLTGADDGPDRETRARAAYGPPRGQDGDADGNA
jgi:hypothetical protein